ncbi:MAG: transposase [Nitrososphaerota archaeon]|nr:transposase [Nitrososphaerota archaeon]
MEEVEEYFPGFIAIIDSFEQEIPRPKNKRRRKSYYSGKRKKHTVKTQLAVNKEGVIFHRTDHVNGRRHDYDLFKENHPKVPSVSFYKCLRLSSRMKINHREILRPIIILHQFETLH